MSLSANLLSHTSLLRPQTSATGQHPSISSINTPTIQQNESVEDRLAVEALWKELLQETAEVLPGSSSTSFPQRTEDQTLMPPPLRPAPRMSGKKLIKMGMDGCARRRQRSSITSPSQPKRLGRPKKQRLETTEISANQSQPALKASSQPMLHSSSTKNTGQPLTTSFEISSRSQLNPNILVLRTPIGYVMDLFDTCIAPTISSSSPLALPLRRQIYRRFVQDLAQLHIANHETLDTEQLFCIALEIFQDAHLLSPFP